MTRITNAYYHGREVIVDGQRRDIIYPSAIYQDVGEADPMTHYGPAFRSSDVMLAYWLDRAAETARIDGETMWLGKIHDQVTFDFPNSPPLTLLIQKDTGYISKMHRQVGDVVVSYTFFNHVIQDGFPVAQDHNVYGGADWIFYSIDRRVVVNDSVDSDVFQIEADIMPEPEGVDQSELTVEALTNAMQMDSPLLEARILTNMASAQYLAGNLSEADQSIERAETIASSNAPEWLTFVYGVKGQIALAKGNTASARTYFGRTFSGEDLAKTSPFFRDFHETAYQAYEQSGDFKPINQERYRQMEKASLKQAVDVEFIEIKQARHIDFCDAALFSPYSYLLGQQKGKIDTHDVMQVINRESLRFIQQHESN